MTLIGLLTDGALLSLMVVSTNPVAARDRAPVQIAFTPYLQAIPTLTVNVGTVKGRFLFDTAGGITAISPEFSRSIGCEPWGRITGHRMRGQRVDSARCDRVRVEIGDIELPVSTVGVFDFGSILPPDAPELHGSLAMDAFSGRAITLDLGNDQLWLETQSSLKKRIESAEELPVRFDRSVQGLALTPFIGVQTEHGLLWFELDTGSDASLMVGKHALPDLKATRSDNGRYQVHAALGKTISLDAEAAVSDLIIDGNIGAPILRKWLVTIDFVHQRLWVSTRQN